jgi:hypothetical protein
MTIEVRGLVWAGTRTRKNAAMTERQRLGGRAPPVLTVVSGRLCRMADMVAEL